MLLVANELNTGIIGIKRYVAKFLWVASCIKIKNKANKKSSMFIKSKTWFEYIIDTYHIKMLFWCC